MTPPAETDLSGRQELRDRVWTYIRSHHTMTVATVSPDGNKPHAASVFYAVDDDLRLIFLSKRTSIHGTHIGEAAPVAITVSEGYENWEEIQGVQLWGEARRLGGAARAAALLVYVKQFPFVSDLLAHPRHAEMVRDLGVYRVEPARAAFTDNRTGAFGREVLELKVGP
jgi:uncharacterized protein YhbP (UPF0306 family)